MDIALSQHVRKHKSDSRYTFYVSDDLNAVLDLTRKAVTDPKNVHKGYRDGVLLIDLPPDDFRIKHRQLKSGDNLIGGFDPRTPGEEPRIWLRSVNSCGQQEVYAPRRVQVVLYRHDVLMETHEATTDAEWELITILGYPTDEAEPMDPWTMCYNHFQLNGGTATGWDDARFVAELRKSFVYWRDKA